MDDNHMDSAVAPGKADLPRKAPVFTTVSHDPENLGSSEDDFATFFTPILDQEIERVKERYPSPMWRRHYNYPAAYPAATSIRRQVLRFIATVEARRQ